MPYSTRAVIFNPVLLAKDGVEEQIKSAAIADFTTAHEELFFGSSRVKRRRTQQVFEGMRANPAEFHHSSDVLYKILADEEEVIELDDPENQLVLLNLIERNPQVRDFFLRDIFEPKPVRPPTVILSGETHLSFEKLSPELLQAKLTEAEYNSYKKNRREWLRNPDNKKTIDRVLDEVATTHVALASAKARDVFLKKLYENVEFGYSFFSRWNIPQAIAAPNPNGLKKLALTNPGAALAILMNEHLSGSLKGVLTTDDKIVILRNAAEHSSFYNREHYFRVTLTKLLPLTKPDEVNLAEFIIAASNPVELLEDLTHDAQVYRTADQQSLYAALAAQAGNIVTQVGNSNKKIAKEVTHVMKRLVVSLVNAYEKDKTPYQAEQLNRLFNDYPQLAEELHLDEITLRKLSTNNLNFNNMGDEQEKNTAVQNFLIRNNLEDKRNQRKIHWFKNFLNWAFGRYKEFFALPSNNLQLIVNAPAAALAPLVSAVAPPPAPPRSDDSEQPPVPANNPDPKPASADSSAVPLAVPGPSSSAASATAPAPAPHAKELAAEPTLDKSAAVPPAVPAPPSPVAPAFVPLDEEDNLSLPTVTMEKLEELKTVVSMEKIEELKTIVSMETVEEVKTVVSMETAEELKTTVSMEKLEELKTVVSMEKIEEFTVTAVPEKDYSGWQVAVIPQAKTETSVALASQQPDIRKVFYSDTSPTLPRPTTGAKALDVLGQFSQALKSEKVVAPVEKQPDPAPLPQHDIRKSPPSSLSSISRTEGLGLVQQFAKKAKESSAASVKTIYASLTTLRLNDVEPQPPVPQTPEKAKTPEAFVNLNTSAGGSPQTPNTSFTGSSSAGESPDVKRELSFNLNAAGGSPQDDSFSKFNANAGASPTGNNSFGFNTSAAGASPQDDSLSKINANAGGSPGNESFGFNTSAAGASPQNNSFVGNAGASPASGVPSATRYFNETRTPNDCGQNDQENKAPSSLPPRRLFVSAGGTGDN